MSYPKNAASPPPFDIGEVRAIADGALQTTDVLVRVKIGTGAFDTGAGTLACDATSGIWTYTPTQAETNAESFIVAIYKANCTGSSQTIVTGASAVAGKVVPADDSITASVFDESTAFPLKAADTGDTTVARKGSGTVTLTSIGTDVADVPTVAEFEARTMVAASYALEATLTAIKGVGWSNETLAAIKAVLDTAAADVAGLDGEAMRGTDGANTTTPPTVGEIADAVLDEAIGGHVSAGSFGWMVTGIDTVTTALGIRVPQVITMAQIGGTGSYYVLGLNSAGAAIPSTVEFEARTIAAADYFVVTDYTAPPSASVIADQVRTELATELGRIDAAVTTRQATVTNLADVVTMAAQFATMVALDGAVYQFTATALELGPSGGTSGGAVEVSSYAAGQDPATLVLNALAASYNTSGSIGAKINAAGNAADPWGAEYAGYTDEDTFGYLTSQLLYILQQVGYIRPTGAVAGAFPVTRGNTLNIVAGASYPSASGRALQIPLPAAPVGSGNACSLAIGTKPTPGTPLAAPLMVATGTFVLTGSTWYASFDLTAIQTAAVSPTDTEIDRVWDLTEVLSDGSLAVIYGTSPCSVSTLIART